MSDETALVEGLPVAKPRRAPIGLTMEEAAYSAAAWVGGETQRSLAATFGYAGPTSVCQAIIKFLLTFGEGVSAPSDYSLGIVSTTKYKHWSEQYGWRMLERDIDTPGRKALVPAALLAFRRSRGDLA